MTRRSFVVLLAIFVSSLSLEAGSEPFRAKRGMVVSQSDIASQIGFQVIRDGGNAVDAAVAVGFALAVTYPRAGNIGGSAVPSYLSEIENGDSTTETFVAIKAGIGNWRWAGVPFFLRTGTHLAQKATEVTLKRRQAPCDGRTGSVRVTSVPRPSADSTRRLPPTNSARSRMFSRPRLPRWP